MIQLNSERVAEFVREILATEDTINGLQDHLGATGQWPHGRDIVMLVRQYEYHLERLGEFDREFGPKLGEDLASLMPGLPTAPLLRRELLKSWRHLALLVKLIEIKAQIEQEGREPAAIEQAFLRLVREAIARPDGSCVECRREIAEERLRAIPWAPRCGACQDSQALREEMDSGGDE